MKISGAAFRTHLEETLDAMGYKPRYADLAAWILKLVNPNEFEYYGYILCYVNDVLLISTYPGIQVVTMRYIPPMLQIMGRIS